MDGGYLKHIRRGSLGSYTKYKTNLQQKELFKF